MIDKFRGKEEEGFFGIYDGHGGPMAAKYTSEVLHKVNKKKKIFLNIE